MTRQLISIEIPFIGGTPIRITSVTEHESNPPSRPIVAHGVTVEGPGLVRAAVSRIVPFAFRKSA